MSAKRKNTPIKYSTDEHNSLAIQHIDSAKPPGHEDMHSSYAFHGLDRHDVTAHLGSEQRDLHDVTGHLEPERRDIDSQACDASVDSDDYSERSNSPGNESCSVDRAPDSDSASSEAGTGRPPRSKKQRLLASLQQDTELQHRTSQRYSPYQRTTSPSTQHHLTNNNLKTTATDSVAGNIANQTNYRIRRRSERSSTNDDDFQQHGDVNIDVIQQLASSLDVESEVKHGVRSIIDGEASVEEKERRFDAMIRQLQSLKQTLAAQQYKQVRHPLAFTAQQHNQVRHPLAFTAQQQKQVRILSRSPHSNTSRSLRWDIFSRSQHNTSS